MINQRPSPEVTDFQCKWRDDGVIDFQENKESVEMISKKDAKEISFGPFVLGWSVQRSGGEGWLYFDKFPGGLARPFDVQYIITEKYDFNEITGKDFAKNEYR